MSPRTYYQDRVGQVSLVAAVIPWLVAGLIIGCELLHITANLSPRALELLGKLLWATSLVGLLGGTWSALKRSYLGVIAIAASVLFLCAATHWEL
jgi:hypothetical protein